ncbi:MAG: hypothetical protein ACYDEC_10805 [Bacteroidia bacterium]
MSVYAKRTKNKHTKDILCIDNFYKKKALIALIKESAKVHEWDYILDFSIHIENEFNLKPSLKTKILRRIKHLLIIKYLYTFLLGHYTKNKTINLAKIIENKFKESNITFSSKEDVVIYQLTQTELNTGVEWLYPNAKVYYMEHGTVDYIYVIQKHRKNGFICIFKESYQKYLSKRNINFSVDECLNKDEFTKAFLDFVPKLNLDIKQIERTSSKRFVLFLMDALEIYQPHVSFWTDYIERCLKEISNPIAYTILIKPHPNQSNEVIEITQVYFKNHHLDFIMLNKPEYVSLSVETIYVYYQSRIDFVFSTFSAAIFYLSFFYQDESKFYYSYYFVKQYIKNAPVQYKNAFIELEELIEEVFVNKYCISLA